MVNDIYLITIDCLRYDKCGFSGYEKDTTPNIDKLAENGAVFEDAIAPGPRTSESIPGILSGRHSYQCDYVEELSYKSIPNNAETFASWLSNHGYTTVGIVANPQLTPIRNFDAGFDKFRNIRIESQGDKFSEEGDTSGNPVLGVGRALLRQMENSPLPLNPVRLAFVGYRIKQLYDGWPTIDGKIVIDNLMSYMSDREGPMFAWTHLNDLHTPIHPRRAKEGGMANHSSLRQFWDDSKRVRHQYAPIYEKAYDSVLKYIDAQVGRFIDFLKNEDRWEKSLVIVTADHGDSMLEHGYYDHGAGAEQRICNDDRDYLYRDLLHVPLVLSGPQVSQTRIQKSFSLTWLNELVAQTVNIERGDFPIEKDIGNISIREFYPSRPVIADALTERGHTIVAHD
ncbi:sulfatase-like hydrolase/transferase [Haladaptatus caseinilyticus]|uniref:sulfatase-like hydrolase/transferase n=1 Tax=Haladaptatus caseinilyticus TaxID=2993314 RepID=UPI00224ACC1D|nr:sulfatase-like hydrolase/transferase [Haladaptatus caseinilyticus]